MDRSTETNSTGPDNAGVKVPPPLVFLVAMLIGLWWDSPWLSGSSAGPVPTVVGAIIALAGVGLIIIAALGHRRAGTNLEPWQPTTAIVKTGVYGYSRNPIYLGMAVTQLGLAICAGSLGALMMIVPAVLFIQFHVIAREENYLEAKFGAAYLDYKSTVRPWF
ncbi:MAG: isoprenylcysteine carboxylmethyltransferase family protein [Alphaproteobacteria bacterium]|nr:isoprenylcysteine carboxylmethyltransferase family protein [Alphaproteobacteria bacterium]